MLRLYLDSSAILKRYVNEPGTSTIDLVFDRAESGDLTLTFSLWNIGEVLGVLDEHTKRGWLDTRDLGKTLNAFTDELVKLMRLRVIEAIPIFAPLLGEAWNLILAHHIYEADALQLVACRYSRSDALLSADRRVVEASRELGLEAFDVANEEEKIKEFLR